MEMEDHFKSCTQSKSKCFSSKIISIFVSSLFLVIILFHIQYSSPFGFSLSARPQRWGFLSQENYSGVIETMTAELKDSVTFLPLIDLRFRETATTGHTWFMSSLNDTLEENETEHLYFPSKASKGRLLCFKGRDIRDGTKNSYALAWRGSLPDSAILLEGLTFVSDTYYNHENLWHGICAVTPLVRWSMKNECLKPARWVLFHWGELRLRMGSWLQQLMQANFGEVKVEGFDRGDVPYCFEKAIVMRHDLGQITRENKLKVSDLLRCKARSYCGLNPRNFHEQDSDYTTCNFSSIQVKVLTNTDIVASPHGAQLSNMLFMDRGGSVMEFFPKGWLENAGVGQYAHHWMADQSGMKHQGAWWDPIGEDCPSPQDHLQCFLFHKDGMVGHNETYFAEWASRVIDQVRLIKVEQPSVHQAKQQHDSKACAC